MHIQAPAFAESAGQKMEAAVGICTDLACLIFRPAPRWSIVWFFMVLQYDYILDEKPYTLAPFNLKIALLSSNHAGRKITGRRYLESEKNTQQNENQIQQILARGSNV